MIFLLGCFLFHFLIFSLFSADLLQDYIVHIREYYFMDSEPYSEVYCIFHGKIDGSLFVLNHSKTFSYYESCHYSCQWNVLCNVNWKGFWEFLIKKFMSLNKIKASVFYGVDCKVWKMTLKGNFSQNLCLKYWMFVIKMTNM